MEFNAGHYRHLGREGRERDRDTETERHRERNRERHRDREIIWLKSKLGSTSKVFSQVLKSTEVLVNVSSVHKTNIIIPQLIYFLSGVLILTKHTTTIQVDGKSFAPSKRNKQIPTLKGTFWTIYL